MTKFDNEIFIIERAMGGDSESYGRLIDLYTPSIYNLCFKMLGNAVDAEDAASMTFLNGYKNIKKFRGDSEFSTWIYKIAVNICYDVLKKNKKQKKVSNIRENADGDDMDYYDITPSNNDVERQAIAREELDALNTALSELPKQYVIAITLYYMENKSYTEISEIMNCSMGTTKSRINRGRENLKKYLENKGNKR